MNQSNASAPWQLEELPHAWKVTDAEGREILRLPKHANCVACSLAGPAAAGRTAAELAAVARLIAGSPVLHNAVSRFLEHVADESVEPDLEAYLERLGQVVAQIDWRGSQ